ncbi:DNA-3-methyladenine glycosylase family protein [Aquisediminimonas sediminicola]|uniref:DNA-3-methyladenine glycosylase family protein n=1 Tax=Alteraquisediminimonas sediminicola TaxID=2676787 RepID=UPI001C8E11A8|nr:DNA-3-methyladenine glycosylase 2 family protein [Aquisediminimonas sediminicola]
MSLSQDDIKTSLDAVADLDPAFAAIIAEIGYPPARVRPMGYETLLRTILGQQVSVHAAAAVWKRLESLVGAGAGPAQLLVQSDEDLRACGLSRQKIGYVRSLAMLVESGEVDLHALPHEDEAAIAELVRIKGIGRWSAEIYLLFAEGRADIWPAGDLAVQIQSGRWARMDARPSEAETRAMAENWRPHRGAVALLAWHQYNNVVM